MKTHLQPISGLDPLLSIEDLAEYLGVPVTSIYDWHVDGKGPCGVRVGRHVKFIQSDVLKPLSSMTGLHELHVDGPHQVDGERVFGVASRVVPNNAPQRLVVAVGELHWRSLDSVRGSNRTGLRAWPLCDEVGAVIHAAF